MKNIYLFLFFLCFSRSMSAQIWNAEKVSMPSTVQMFNLSAPDSKTVWVSGYEGTFYKQPWTYEDGNTTVARSTDGGLTWAQSTINVGEGGSITSLFALDSLTAWVTCVNNGEGGKVFKTIDGGVNWKYQLDANFTNNIQFSGFANWVYFWNEDEGICMGNPINGVFEIFRTTNGGHNWSRLISDFIPTALQGEMGMPERYDVKGDTIWFGTSGGRIFRSIYRGQDWEAFTSGNTKLDAIAFSKTTDSGIGFANDFTTTPYSSQVIYAVNSGEHWTIPVKTSFSNQAVFDVTYVPKSDYIVVTTRGNDEIGPFNTYLSRNNGATWLQIDNKAAITKLRFVNPHVGYGGGHKISGITTSTFYRYQGEPLTGLLTPSVLDANINLSPNPTADQLNIQLTYKDPSNFRLNINNLLGELVYFEDFKDVSKINKSLNIKQFPSGTYIVTIANPTGSLSRKIVKTE